MHSAHPGTPLCSPINSLTASGVLNSSSSPDELVPDVRSDNARNRCAQMQAQTQQECARLLGSQQLLYTGTAKFQGMGPVGSGHGSPTSLPQRLLPGNYRVAIAATKHPSRP